MTTRTRFAPSPTGFAHVGNIRTALFAFLVARHNDGQFILRLEDTDKKREVAGTDDYIINAVKKLGMNYDEGPDIGGSFAPYRQSERLDIYKKWAEKLVAAGRAYADPYSPEEIQQFRDEAVASKKPFLYRNHRPENPPVWDGSRPLRFKSQPQDYSWHDAVMGEMHAGAEAVDDFILIKSDGFPTYNFAHIVDDAEMKITHVIRGQEFIASMPNYLNLYEALNLDKPIFATVPHILAESGNKKLGKRDGAKDVLEYLRDGFVVEALDNFIASLGWNDGTEQEIFSMTELIEKFSLERVQKSGARFDEKRLVWMNAQWIKRLSLDDLYERTLNDIEYKRTDPDIAIPSIIGQRIDDFQNKVDAGYIKNLAYFLSTGDIQHLNISGYWGFEGFKNKNEEYKKQILLVVQERLKTLADLPALTEYFFARPTPNWSMIENNKQLKKIPRNELENLIKITFEKLSALDESDFANEETLQNKLNELLTETVQKPPVLFGIIRYALTWAPFSPGLPETMRLLGREETLARIEAAL